VAVKSPETTVLGFYSLSASSINAADLPPELAINQSSKGQGLGQFLLLDALYRSLQAAPAIAAMAVVVDAKDAAAAAFYERYGFMPLSASEGRMFLPMKTVATLF